jgi:hypothetical protein
MDAKLAALRERYAVHSLTSGLLPGYPEPENIYIQLSHYRQRRYLLPCSLSLRLLH